MGNNGWMLQGIEADGLPSQPPRTLTHNPRPSTLDPQPPRPTTPRPTTLDPQPLDPQPPRPTKNPDKKSVNRSYIYGLLSEGGWWVGGGARLFLLT